MLDVRDRLRIAAPNTSRSSCGTLHQLLRDRAERFQALQPERQRGRHVLGALAFGRIGIGQQQARFQIGEPRRHHEIIGGKFEPQLARLPR